MKEEKEHDANTNVDDYQMYVRLLAGLTNLKASKAISNEEYIRTKSYIMKKYKVKSDYALCRREFTSLRKEEQAPTL